MENKILHTAPGMELCLDTYNRVTTAINDFGNDFISLTGKKLDKQTYELLISKSNPQFSQYIPKGTDQNFKLNKLITSFRNAQAALPGHAIHGYNSNEIKLIKGTAKFNADVIRRKYFEMHREVCSEGAELVERAVDSLNALYSFLKDKGLEPSFTGGLTRLPILGPQGIIKTDQDRVSPDWSKLYNRI